MSNDLFDLKNAYYIGNYQQCINEALKSKEPSDEKDVFMYRAYLAQKKYRVIFDGINSSACKDLQLLKDLATYMTGDPDVKQKIVEKMKKESAIITEDECVLPIVAATIFAAEEDYENALRVVVVPNDLECMALNVQLLLKIDRIDLAQKKLKKMVEKDEDSTLTQLAQAWVNIHLGGDKLKEAYYIYQDLIDKFQATPMLLNGVAVSHLMQDQPEDAEGSIQQALEKDDNNAEALINLIHLSIKLGRSNEVTNRLFSQLREAHGENAFVTEYDSKCREFDALCEKFGRSV